MLLATNITNRSSLHLLLLLALTACGGGGDEAVSVPPVDYAGYQAQWAILQAAWTGVTITDPTTLPISGTAVLGGVMNMTAQSTTGLRDMSGTVTLSTVFSTNSLSGNASNFIDDKNSAMSGILAITGGILDRGVNTSVSPVFSANIDGTLSGGGDSFQINGDLAGSFLGPSNLGVSGIVNGFATSAFGTGFLFGGFFAEQ